MERLTKRDDKTGLPYYPHCFREDTCDGIASKSCGECRFNIVICERLASYEDTNITPEQIKEIDKLYTEKCEELAMHTRNWVPFEKEWPEEEKDVLIQFESGKMAVGKLREVGYQEYQFFVVVNENEYMETYDTVKAWQQLPEEYRGEI